MRARFAVSPTDCWVFARAGKRSAGPAKRAGREVRDGADGTQGDDRGNAIADVLFGKVDPGGKLPVTFPRNVGQIPLYYDHEPTGRPADPGNKYTSKYLDSPVSPLYPFGYGLSYTTFEIGNVSLGSGSMSPRGHIDVSAQVTNTGGRAGDEVVQLYIHDPVASVSQPVRRLRGFQRVALEPGESKTVTFRLEKARRRRRQLRSAGSGELRSDAVAASLSLRVEKAASA